MLNINTWVDNFLQTLDNHFGDRVFFAGLQGSYARNEATETSDIDMVIILDELGIEDIQTYNDMLDTLTHRNLVCGFISGKSELLNWEPSDLFQFYYDTKPLKGNLNDLLPLLDNNAIAQAIKIGACNIYHACVHNMLHEKSIDILKSLYKSATFVVQAVYFEQTGKYINSQRELVNLVSTEEHNIIEIFLCLKNGGKIHFQKMSETLFNWSKNMINK